jgi:hypothetical protein
MSLLELFDDILARPALYVGQRSIFKIKAFIDGYRYARWSPGDNSETDPYYGFQGWVQRRFNIRTAHSWDRIIAFMSSDEVDAFESTKKLWGEYKAEACPVRDVPNDQPQGDP